jgi:hypothetical protein
MGVVTDEAGMGVGGAVDDEIGGGVGQEIGDEDCLGAVFPAAFPPVEEGWKEELISKLKQQSVGYGEGLTKRLRTTILACDNAAIIPIPDLWLEHQLHESLGDPDSVNQFPQIIRGHVEFAGGPSVFLLETQETVELMRLR